MAAFMVSIRAYGPYFENKIRVSKWPGRAYNLKLGGCAKLKQDMSYVTLIYTQNSSIWYQIPLCGYSNKLLRGDTTIDKSTDQPGNTQVRSSEVEKCDIKSYKNARIQVNTSLIDMPVLQHENRYIKACYDSNITILKEDTNRKLISTTKI